jgi:hypothetical protein
VFSIRRNAEQFLLSGAAMTTQNRDEVLLAATVSKNWIGLIRVHERRSMGIESSGGAEITEDRALIGGPRSPPRVFDVMVRRRKM